MIIPFTQVDAFIVDGQPLTPGTYTLVATTRGGRTVEREVTLVPGQTTSVTLAFE